MVDADAGMPQGMRASDEDREKIAAELRTHCVAGRISLDELDQRVARAMAAVTLRQLAELVYDLPQTSVAPAPDRAGSVPRIGPPGVHPFTYRLVLPSPVLRAHDLALDTIAPSLNAIGYELVTRSPETLVFERRRRAAWRAVVVVMLFPLGLLALIGSDPSERIAISFEARGALRTHMTVTGVAPRRIRRQLAQLALPAHAG